MKHILAGMLFSLCAGLLAAAPSVPDEGLKAEMAGDWNGALSVYQSVLEQQPGRADLWLRMADIYHHLDQEQDKLHALEQAAQLRPGDAEIAFRLSLAYSMADRPADAVQQCLRAAELEPGNQDYLHACLKQANWAGDQMAAEQALEDYLTRFGNTEHYQRAQANLLLQRGHFYAASDLLDPLAEDHPDDYDTHFARVLATRASGQPSAALESVQAMERLKPEHPETAEVARVTRAPLRSLVGVYGDYQFDADDIRTASVHTRGELALRPETRVLLGYNARRVSTRQHSAFIADDGDRSTMDYYGWIGIRHQLHRRLEVEGRVGRGNVESGGDYGYYKLEGNYHPHDDVMLQFTRERALYALSPLAVSREIIENRNRLRTLWRPAPLYQVEGWLSASDFSDDNSRQEVFLAPSRNVYSNGPWGVNLGLSGQWFSFDKDLNNGYYDPDYFRRYAGTFLFYWSPNADDWVGLRSSLGWHKDNTFTRYEFGSDIELEALIGRYQDWQLHGRIAYADRLLETGRYYGTSIHLGVLRRF
ncbi:tetratricopeptide repeat protein [Marinobacter lipolyticus]|uniref:tetratricopeptide repeat protein n=1 Tax=Marinobacter lipolyticus TaxID=209639 RepID=UPI003A9353D3